VNARTKNDKGHVDVRNHRMGRFRSRSDSARCRPRGDDRTMACRGPDAKGSWLEPHAVLGHRRLAVIEYRGRHPAHVGTHRRGRGDDHLQRGDIRLR
jgi:hypothetical protein